MKLPSLAAAACAGFAALIIVEVLTAPSSRVRPPPAQPARAAAPPSPATAPARASETDVATILARPLFAKDRHPAPQTGTGPADEPQSGPTLPRLSAVVIASSQRWAIFEGQGKPITVHEGQSINAFKVVSIAPGTVTLAGPDGSRKLRPSFDANKQVVADVPAAQPPSILDRLNTEPPPVVPLPTPPTLDQLLARQRGQRRP